MPSNQYPLIAREGWPALAVLLALIIVVKFFIGLGPALVLSVLLGVFIFLLRDPDRIVPASPLAVVSPMYGIVTDIDEVEDKRLSRNAKRIRVKMSFTDIYSLRSPIEGKVMEQWISQAGKSSDRLQLEYWIRTDEGDDIVTVISLRKYVKFLHIYLQSGERIGQGQRCGYLYFGGTADVLVPMNTRIDVQPGERVDSGSSILAQLVHTSAVSSISI
jgi:phosphatidylserine decarboxylase